MCTYHLSSKVVRKRDERTAASFKRRRYVNDEVNSYYSQHLIYILPFHARREKVSFCGTWMTLYGAQTIVRISHEERVD